MKRLRVAMIAPPWLPIPPNGYGGIENVLYGLISELLKLDVDVELFCTGDTTLKASKNHWLYKTGQYEHIHKPQFVSAPVGIAHLLYAVNYIKKAGNFDIVHDHNGYFGLAAFANTDEAVPPIVHTLHGPPFYAPDRDKLGIPDTRPMWQQLATTKKLHLVPISEAMTRAAPKILKPRLLQPIHNAVALEDFPFVSAKDDNFITLARFHPEKGQHIAVQTCLELDVPLKMAGVVCDIGDPKKVLLELANPLSVYRALVDFRYFSDKIFPFLEPGVIENVGEVSGRRKLNFISRAKALLFPIQWDEPFGMAVIEAMACGTPVVAMNRGAMPEIITHGYNGFLANNIREFKQYAKRVGEIDPQACRQTVEQRFSSHSMAEKYLLAYKQVIDRY